MYFLRRASFCESVFNLVGTVLFCFLRGGKEMAAVSWQVKVFCAITTVEKY